MKILNIILTAGVIVALAATTLYNFSETAASLLIWPYFIAIPLFLILYRFGKWINKIGRQKQLDQGWGKASSLPFDIELSNIKSAYEAAEFSEGARTAEVDEGSWNDLNLDEVYAHVNHCLSSPGYYQLYKSLKNPLIDKGKLANRESMIAFFEEEAVKTGRGACDLLGRALLSLRTSEHLDILKLIDRKNDSGRLFSVCIVMRALAILSIAGLFFLKIEMAILFIFLIFIGNQILSNILKKRTKGSVPALSGLLRLIRASEEITGHEFACEAVTNLKNSLKEETSKLHRVKTFTRFLYGKTIALDNPVDVLWMYIDIFFLIEAIAFYRSLNFIHSHRSEAFRVFALIGELDGLRSIVSLRNGFSGEQTYCQPVFNIGQRFIKTKEIYHPLLFGPVKNDIELDTPGLLLTGANMAGKSTFLRTIGINSILAQSILTVFADSFESDIFIIRSSIDKQDSIMSGKSLYYAEAERVGNILKLASRSELTVLCLFDELLSGTNTEEREAAVTSIIRGAAAMNTLCLAATHDRRVVDEFSGSFQLRHFTYHFDDSGLVFDYKLRAGRVKNGNAIRLLEYLGYPEKIVYDAYELIK
ncbi:MAG: hypothetical protein JEZ04_03995 [Spirochaetales bacterium]|nr:hypothetical protein [Spirochaetales bacterium]